MKTFWSNPGKRGGSIDISLWMNSGGESWSQSPPSDSVELFLEPGSNSVVVDMIFEPSLPGVPVLYVIDGGDFQNLAYPVEGMVVSSAVVSSAAQETPLSPIPHRGRCVITIVWYPWHVRRSKDDD